MQNNMVRRKGAVLLAAACIFSLAACSSQQAASIAGSAANAKSASQQSTAGQTSVYGKVTAVDGSKVTLSLGALNQGAGGGPGNASGQKNNPPAKNGSASESANSGTAPSRQQGGRQGNFEMLTLTGETKTITISDESILTRQSMRRNGGNRKAPDTSSAVGTNDTNSTDVENNTNGNSKGTLASLSDITVGSILKVTSETGTDKLLSVQILGAGSRGQSASGTSSQS